MHVHKQKSMYAWWTEEKGALQWTWNKNLCTGGPRQCQPDRGVNIGHEQKGYGNAPSVTAGRGYNHNTPVCQATCMHPDSRMAGH